ncbi:MAG: YlbF family regulator [Clostridia bacterium]
MVIQKARELGLELSESAEFQDMLRARTAMESDAALMAMVNEFSSIQHSIMDMMSDENANAEAIRARSDDLERMQDELVSHPLFASMLSTQNVFQQLMGEVNSTIGACIGMEPQEHSCGHECGSCDSCKH